MDNQENVSMELDAFNQDPSIEISSCLENYLKYVATTGCTIFPWKKIKILFLQKMLQVINTFYNESIHESNRQYPNVENVTFDEMKTRLVYAIEQFNGIPFTIQRLCELITSPKKHYNLVDKFLRGIEKNLKIVTTVDPLGNKIYVESKTDESSCFNGLHRPNSPIYQSPASAPFLSWHPNSPASPFPSSTFKGALGGDNSNFIRHFPIQHNQTDVDRISNCENIKDPLTAHLSDNEDEIEENTRNNIHTNTSSTNENNKNHDTKDVLLSVKDDSLKGDSIVNDDLHMNLFIKEDSKKSLSEVESIDIEKVKTNIESSENNSELENTEKEPAIVSHRRNSNDQNSEKNIDENELSTNTN